MKLLCLKTKELLKPYVKYEIIGIILTFLYSIFTTLMPKISEYLIDEVIPAKSYKKLLIGIVLFISICVLQPLIGWIKDKVFVNITENITFDIRKRLYEKIIYARFEFFDNVKNGELISIIMNDGRAISDFISNIFAVLLKNSLMIIVIVVGMVSISWEISIIVIVLFLAFIIMNYKFKNVIQKLSENIQNNYDKICSYISHTNKVILSIKMNGQEKTTINGFEKIISKMRRDNISYDKTNILINNITAVITIVCLGVIYGWGALKVIDGKLTIGNVIAIGLYFQLLAQPLSEMMNASVSVNAAIPIFKRIYEYMGLEQEELGNCDNEFVFSKIEIRHLSFSYANCNIATIHDINCSFPSRGLVFLMGESGSGKTTIARLLMGMYDIGRGKIVYGTNDINDITSATLRKNISYVPQECELINDTIWNNICYGIEKVSETEIIEICKKLRLHDKIMKLEQMYNTIVTEKANLSLGEQQRILIARAVLKNSDIIIMDEPLSSLDKDNINTFADIISDLMNTKLIIMITHQECDKLNPVLKIIIDKGTISSIIKSQLPIT